MSDWFEALCIFVTCDDTENQSETSRTRERDERVINEWGQSLSSVP